MVEEFGERGCEGGGFGFSIEVGHGRSPEEQSDCVGRAPVLGRRPADCTRGFRVFFLAGRYKKCYIGEMKMVEDG